MSASLRRALRSVRHGSAAPIIAAVVILAVLSVRVPVSAAASSQDDRDIGLIVDDRPGVPEHQPGSIDDIREHLDTAVRVERRQFGRGEAIWIVNDLYAPVEIELRVEEPRNVARVPPGPIRQLLPPRSKTSMFSLQPEDAARPLGFVTHLDLALGDPGARHEALAYPVPWLGGPFSISQGANGSFSHFTPKNRHAIDIAMPVGTPVVASRAGVVVSAENHQAGPGRVPEGNFVRILHPDGTLAVYLHLSYGSLRVGAGDQVRQGQLLGLSGDTGNSSGPHLHFAIQRNSGMGLVSIPFRLSNQVAPGGAPLRGGR